MKGHLLLLVAFAAIASAQSPTTFQYFYDDLNQLSKVVDSTGVVVEYVYDSVGKYPSNQPLDGRTGGPQHLHLHADAGSPIKYHHDTGSRFQPDTRC